MKEKYRDINFREKTKQLLEEVSQIVGEYEDKGYCLTLRQLYYQLVGRDIIPNDLGNYQKISRLVADARYAGLIDWDSIEDRGRPNYMHNEYTDIEDLIKTACDSYRLPRWDGQKHYVEVVTEKDALTSIIKPITDKWHIRLTINRGYDSASCMYEAAKRLEDSDKDNVILYVGDHDPSGLDMIRDIEDRLHEFKTNTKIVHVALRKDQVNEYNLPPNYAKSKDPRRKRYEKEHGDESWEVDALPPEALNNLLETEIKHLVDVGLMNKIIQQEKQEIKELQKLGGELND